MAPKVPQRTPKERLLDANRTPEFAMQLPLWRASQTLPGAQIELLLPSFDYFACVRLLRLHIIAVEVYCHACCRASHLLHPLGG